jgi:hypothetical protein
MDAADLSLSWSTLLLARNQAFLLFPSSTWEPSVEAPLRGLEAELQGMRAQAELGHEWKAIGKKDHNDLWIGGRKVQL